MRLQDSVEQLFVDNPDLGKAEAIKRLKEIKKPKANKSLWKASTIRSSVSTYFNKKEKEDTAMHIKASVEPVESRSNFEMEEKEIGQHKPNDPFAIKLDGNAGEKVGQVENVETAVNAERFKKEIVDDVSQKILKQASMDAKPFRDEIISIISDLVSSLRDEFTEIKKEISNLRTQGLPTYEPVVKYDDLELRESTIATIHENTEEKELKEESDYVDSLIENEKEYMSVLQVYHKLVDLAKEAKNGVQLKLFYENDRLSYDKKPVGRFGINPKHLIVGIAIGVSMGIVIWFICTSLTTVPPSTLPPIP